MPGNYPNIYQTARTSAGLTQERAAELLDISPESVKAYEGGARVPPDALVRRMCEAYAAPELALEHASATDVLGVLDARPKPLPLAAISLANRLRSASASLVDLLEIAEDGLIDADERPVFDAIVADLRQTVAAAYQVIYAPEGAKKDRPEAATSKRSARAHCSENHCKRIISQPDGKRKPLLTGGDAK